MPKLSVGEKMIEYSGFGNWMLRTMDSFLTKKDDIAVLSIKETNQSDTMKEYKENCLEEIPSGFFMFRLWEDENYYIWDYMRKSQNKVLLQCLMTKDWKHIICNFDETNTNGCDSFEMIGKFFQYAILKMQRIVLHGVLMEYDNKGIIISAPSGTGKSTHAHFWRNEYRALIINGDRALCGKKNGIWTGYGMPWCGSSGEYINRDIPVKALVVLERGDENKVCQLSPLEGFQRMYENIVAPFWEEDLMNQALDMFDDMISQIPVFLLICKPEEEAAAVLKEQIDKL